MGAGKKFLITQIGQSKNLIYFYIWTIMESGVVRVVISTREFIMSKSSYVSCDLLFFLILIANCRNNTTQGYHNFTKIPQIPRLERAY